MRITCVTNKSIRIYCHDCVWRMRRFFLFVRLLLTYFCHIDHALSRPRRWGWGMHQKRPIHIKRDLYIWKETYTYMIRDLYIWPRAAVLPWNSFHLYMRPISPKRDLETSKEIYITQKTNTKDMYKQKHQTIFTCTCLLYWSFEWYRSLLTSLGLFWVI